MLVLTSRDPEHTARHAAELAPIEPQADKLRAHSAARFVIDPLCLQCIGAYRSNLTAASESLESILESPLPTLEVGRAPH